MYDAYLKVAISVAQGFIGSQEVKNSDNTDAMLAIEGAIETLESSVKLVKKMFNSSKTMGNQLTKIDSNLEILNNNISQQIISLNRGLSAFSKK